MKKNAKKLRGEHTSMLFQLMLQPDFLTNGTSAVGLLLELFKWLLVILSGIYVLVAVIITRQIGLMRATVSTPHTARIKLISLVHLLLSVLLLLYFIFVL